MLHATSENRGDRPFHQRGKTGLRVRPARQLGLGQGAFGQHFIDQHRRQAAGNQCLNDGWRRVHAVAAKAGGAANGKGW